MNLFGGISAGLLRNPGDKILENGVTGCRAQGASFDMEPTFGGTQWNACKKISSSALIWEGTKGMTV